MARIFFDRTGASDSSLPTNANRIQFPASTTEATGVLLLTNDADSAVVGRVNAETGINLNGLGAGEDMDYRLDAKSYMLIPYVQSAGATESLRRVDISTSHAFTAHRTAANSGEHVYLAIVQ